MRLGTAFFVFASFVSFASVVSACSGTSPRDLFLEPLPPGCADGGECSGAREAEDAAPARVEAPRAVDASEPPPLELVPADDCTEAALGKTPPVVVRPGAPGLFTAELGDAKDSFRSGCVQAIGPDRVQPIRVEGGTRLLVTAETTSSLAGPVVLYAKETCASSVDLACAADTKLSFPVVPGRTYFLHVDSTKPQEQLARVTVAVEAL